MQRFEPAFGRWPPAEHSSAGERCRAPRSPEAGEALPDRLEIRSIAITGLFVLAVLYTLYFARAFLLPIVLAVLLDFLLSPLIRALKRLRIPEPLGAALVVLALLGVLGGAPTAWPIRRAHGSARRPQSLRDGAEHGSASCAGRSSR